MSEAIGKRGHPIIACAKGHGFNYLAWAEEIVGLGKPLEQFTRDEHRQALSIAISALKERGEWPEGDPRQLEGQRRRHGKRKVA